MKEKIYNLFVFHEQKLIHELGGIEHEFDGTDFEKGKFLRESVASDILAAKRFPLPDRYVIEIKGKEFPGFLTSQAYWQMQALGKTFELFSEILDHFDSAQEPYACITPIVDGQIQDTNVGDLIVNLHDHGKMEFQIPQDYFDKYNGPEGFRLYDLIKDDFFAPIKLLNQHEHYIGAMKLLLSTIDTFAFLEYDDSPGSFQRWLAEYSKVETLHVTADEIWELRNSLLHMTNFDSRRVRGGKTRRLLVGAGPHNFPDSSILNFHSFYEIIHQAMKAWLSALDQNRDRLKGFFDRYDRIVSDARQGKVEFSEPP